MSLPATTDSTRAQAVAAAKGDADKQVETAVKAENQAKVDARAKANAEENAKAKAADAAKAKIQADALAKAKVDVETKAAEATKVKTDDSAKAAEAAKAKAAEAAKAASAANAKAAELAKAKVKADADAADATKARVKADADAAEATKAKADALATLTIVHGGQVRAASGNNSVATVDEVMGSGGTKFNVVATAENCGWTTVTLANTTGGRESVIVRVEPDTAFEVSVKPTIPGKEWELTHSRGCPIKAARSENPEIADIVRPIEPGKPVKVKGVAADKKVKIFLESESGRPLTIELEVK